MSKSISFLIIVSVLLVSGCKTTEKNSKNTSPVIANIGNKPVHADEFEYVYTKNLPTDSAKSEKKIREYLDLFINFKLKVLDAESLGLDTLGSFKSELDGYRQQLSQPYLTEKSVTETLVKQAYERMKEEIKASHLLITCKEDADPEDTLKAYNKAKELRERAVKGESFEELAKTYSQDPSAKSNSGDLGYFTSLQMVYPFEEAAYKTPKGDISQPVRTKFGYHVIKIYDKRPSQGKVKVAHIMIRTNPEMPVDQAKIAKDKIDEIYARLQKGEEWNLLCQQFSQDASSNKNGGELRVFGTSELGISSFEEIAFALKNPNDYSAPFPTPYGWHIVKLIEKQPLPPFSEIEASLKQRVSKDSRSELNKAALLERLKRENQFIENTPNLKLAIAKADSTLNKARWTYAKNDKELSKSIFTVNNQKYTTGDFYAFVEKQQQARNDIKPASYMSVLYKDYVKRSLLTYEESHLADKHPDYKNLLQEYRDGILFFQRMQDEVWTKSLTDSIGAEKYFNQNKEKYVWGRRAKVSVYDGKDEKVISEVKEALKQKMYPVENPKAEILYFEKNKQNLSIINENTLLNAAEIIKRDTSLIIEISSHSDIKEIENISAKRAKSVADFLLNKGVNSKQIITKDFGRFKPVSKTDRNKNIRTELNFYSGAKSALEKKINKNDALHLQITEGTFQKGDNQYIDALPDWKKGEYTIEKNGRLIYIEVLKIEEPRLKTFQEARGQVVSDYQNYLEKIWIESLRKKYPVVLKSEEVDKVVSKLK